MLIYTNPPVDFDWFLCVCVWFWGEFFWYEKPEVQDFIGLSYSALYFPWDPSSITYFQGQTSLELKFLSYSQMPRLLHPLKVTKGRNTQCLQIFFFPQNHFFLPCYGLSICPLTVHVKPNHQY